MIEVDPGHQYYLTPLDGDKDNLVTYVKREGDKYPGNVGHYSGTTIQEVCRMQIARLKYVANQSHIVEDYVSYNEDHECIEAQRDTIYLLEKRAARRHNRILLLSIEELAQIELFETCSKCGHIKPETHVECLEEVKP